MFLVLTFVTEFFPKYQFVYLFIHKLDPMDFFFTLPDLKLGINAKNKYIIYIYILNYKQVHHDFHKKVINEIY